MCGIVGIYQKKPIKKTVLEQMTRVLSHRGPDDEGFFMAQNIALGHRRLAIIDLTASGHQPMFNEDGTIVLVFNGEIYNFLELKKELIKTGHQFKSNSDTEVILHAFEEWGQNAPLRFNGMWALAVVDLKENLILLAGPFGN